MNVLVVCSGNAPEFSFPVHQAFIYDQAESVCRYFPSVRYTVFFIKGKGISGYLTNLSLLRKKIKDDQPDLIHAHGGHVGLLCGLQRKVPVVVTFHGSDINLTVNRWISVMASLFCRKVICVSRKLKARMPVCFTQPEIIPCGVDFDVFYPLEKEEAKKKLGIPVHEDFILFASNFENSIKNYPLAAKAAALIRPVEIREIKNRSRQEVSLLMNAADLLLLTSLTEGSPQVIKEAMACNCPIVATNVGDIAEVIGSTPGCYLTGFDPADIAEKIEQILASGKRTNGREKIGHLDNRIIAERIMNVCHRVVKG